MSLWPNPANRVLNILLLNGGEGSSVNITSLTGTAKINSSVSGTLATLDISSLPAGLYVVTVVNENGKVLKEKVMLNNQ